MTTAYTIRTPSGARLEPCAELPQAMQSAREYELTGVQCMVVRECDGAHLAYFGTWHERRAA